MKPTKCKSRFEVTICHHQLGHALPEADVSSYNKGKSLPHASCTSVACEPCAKGEFRRYFPGFLNSACRIGRFHVDTRRKVKIDSIQSLWDFLTVVDEYSRYTKASTLRSKSEISVALLRYIKQFGKKFGYTIAVNHENGGPKSTCAFEVLDWNEVEMSTTTTYTSESSGLHEVTYEIILSVAYTVLSKAGLPEWIWQCVESLSVASMSDNSPSSRFCISPCAEKGHVSSPTSVRMVGFLSIIIQVNSCQYLRPVSVTASTSIIREVVCTESLPLTALYAEGT